MLLLFLINFQLHSLHSGMSKSSVLEKVIANSPDLEARRKLARTLCRQMNSIDDNKQAIYRKIFCKHGERLEIWNNFFCEFGDNITFGDDVFLNANCVMLDSFSINIGSHVAVGPNVGFYTTNHSLKIAERREQIEYGAPITIGDDVWVGGNVVFLPGVVIGSGCVIGAGSVVTKDVPPSTILRGVCQKPVKSVPQNFGEGYGDIPVA